MERVRGYGQGEVRIGEYLEVGEDIYSLGFISQIHDSILDTHFDVITGRLIEDHEHHQTSKKAAEQQASPKNTGETPKPITSINQDDDRAEYDEFGFKIERNSDDDENDQQMEEDHPDNTERPDALEQDKKQREAVALQERCFEIKKQKRLNIAVHVVLTFVL